MKDFSAIRFKGTFRNYQQKLLDETNTHIKDGKMHVVAAPGSGKTVLGLELIRRLGKPTLVLSPTIVIAQQWGERFDEMFLPEGDQLRDYVSQNLRDPALITSITYQALHAAYSRLVLRQEMFESDDESSAAADSEIADALETTTDSEIAEADETVEVAEAPVAFVTPISPTPTDPTAPEEAQTYDFRDFALIDFIRATGIKTICLDEAHHLKREWQKALEGFIRKIEHEVTIIALTATPPYDSTPVEWSRYITLCGEIDSEIFVPELVAQKTLCPHQDYIYFNFPTKEELEIMREYQDRVLQFITELRASSILSYALAATGLHQRTYDREWLYENARELLALFALCQLAGVTPPEEPRRLLTMGNALPPLDPPLIESAVNFILANEQKFGEQVVSQLASLCRAHRLLSKGKAIIATDGRLNRVLISSLGKLESISAIVREEHTQLGDGLRMLVLTDFIRKDYLSVIGTQTRIDAIGTVPVFETARRALPGEARIGLLAGTLVIWPTDRLTRLEQLAAEQGATCRARPLGETAYSTVDFSGGNRLKVTIATAAFQQGDVQVLVGTKALLGEGWDSPCVNSLIMASFIGSYVLSNQMRGRAIRVMKGVPDKTANIWHLVAIEPPPKGQSGMNTDKNGSVEGGTAGTYSGVGGGGGGASGVGGGTVGMYSGVGGDTADKDAQLFLKILDNNQDFRTLKRRFECFFGPAYSRHEIASGIERIDIIKPPYDAAGIAAINAEMLRRAADRPKMAQDWTTCLELNGSPEVNNVSAVRKDAIPKPFLFRNLRRFILFTAVFTALFNIFFEVLKNGIMFQNLSPTFAIVLVVMLALLFVCLYAGMEVLRSLNPKKTVEAFARGVKDTLFELGKITSNGILVKVSSDELGVYINCSLENATIREQSVFTQAMSELLGAIDNPRYLLIRRKSAKRNKQWDYRESYACPSVISSAKIAEVFKKHLKKRGLPYHTVYTRNAEGFRILNACRNKSLITKNSKQVRRYLRVG
jgi:superfamily II DNA or RNA helicase